MTSPWAVSGRARVGRSDAPLPESLEDHGLCEVIGLESGRCLRRPATHLIRYSHLLPPWRTQTSRPFALRRSSVLGLEAIVTFEH